MNVTDVQQLISNLGFPIVACFVMYKQLQRNNETITKLTETLSTIDARLQNLERVYNNDQ